MAGLFFLLIPGIPMKFFQQELVKLLLLMFISSVSVSSHAVPGVGSDKFDQFLNLAACHISPDTKENTGKITPYCSASLVKPVVNGGHPRLVTAAHCLYKEDKSQGLIPIKKLKVRCGCSSLKVCKQEFSVALTDKNINRAVDFDAATVDLTEPIPEGIKIGKAGDFSLILDAYSKGDYNRLSCAFVGFGRTSVNSHDLGAFQIKLETLGKLPDQPHGILWQGSNISAKGFERILKLAAQKEKKNRPEAKNLPLPEIIRAVRPVLLNGTPNSCELSAILAFEADQIYKTSSVNAVPLGGDSGAPVYCMDWNRPELGIVQVGIVASMRLVKEKNTQTGAYEYRHVAMFFPIPTPVK